MLAGALGRAVKPDTEQGEREYSAAEHDEDELAAEG